MSRTTARAKLFRRLPLLVFIALPIVLVGLLTWYLHGHEVAVLSPKGPISLKEKHLMAIAIGLSAIVVIPVFIMTILITVKYRESNPKKQTYTPDWDGSRKLETVWWGIPIVIIGILSVITWQSSFALDPYKPLASNNAPLHVQVVALDWKWLFIYPNQKVASVNELALPVGTPVDFEITSDTVMNSFWIPSLGSQIYAMPGMVTSLHLMATMPGAYVGSSANISGSGFAGMRFAAKAMPMSDFKTWVMNAQHAPTTLSYDTYRQLARPSKNTTVSYYKTPAAALYTDVVMQYMMPGMDMQDPNMQGMDMSGMSH